jgi:hypothetical protein
VAPLVIYVGLNSRITAAGILAIVDHAYWLMRGAFF